MAPPFVLVHGAWHAGACWQPLVDELEARGERAIAVDLPADDPAATLDDYVQAVVDGAAVFEEPVVVVGHSLGGMTIPLVVERRPVAGLVFVAAIVPVPGQATGTVVGREVFVDGFDELIAQQTAQADGSSRWDDEGATIAFYHDVPADRLGPALAALRLQCWGPVNEPWPAAAYPDVPMRYIACADDRILRPSAQLDVARERLGVEPDVLQSSHSPFLSHPAELADLLLEPIRSGT